ncbi:hypothetical protein KJ966_24630 [bacterium]|nr:hypothetical protein [bacterium]
MRIHDEATNDIQISTPEGWPTINVSGFQDDFSIDDKVSSEKLKDLLTLAVSEIVNCFDESLMLFPMEGVEVGYFRRAVYQLAYAKLIPELPVNRQHKSEPQDVNTIRERIAFFEGLSVENRKCIKGFKSESVEHLVSFGLI